MVVSICRVTSNRATNLPAPRIGWFVRRGLCGAKTMAPFERRPAQKFELRNPGRPQHYCLKRICIHPFTCSLEVLGIPAIMATSSPSKEDDAIAKQAIEPAPADMAAAEEPSDAKVAAVETEAQTAKPKDSGSGDDTPAKKIEGESDAAAAKPNNDDNVAAASKPAGDGGPRENKGEAGLPPQSSAAIKQVTSPDTLSKPPSQAQAPANTDSDEKNEAVSAAANEPVVAHKPPKPSERKPDPPAKASPRKKLTIDTSNVPIVSAPPPRPASEVEKEKKAKLDGDSLKTGPGKLFDPTDPKSMPSPPPEDENLSRSWSETIFPMKLYDILCNPDFHHAISWMSHGRSWKVLNKDFFMSEICPQYFAQTRYESFIRQVNGWGFKRMRREGPDRSAYYHEHFLRGYPNLIDHMRRPAPGEKSRDVREEPDFYSVPAMPPLPPPDPNRTPKVYPIKRVGRPAGSTSSSTRLQAQEARKGGGGDQDQAPTMGGGPHGGIPPQGGYYMQMPYPVPMSPYQGQVGPGGHPAQQSQPGGWQAYPPYYGYYGGPGYFGQQGAAPQAHGWPQQGQGPLPLPPPSPWDKSGPRAESAPQQQPYGTPPGQGQPDQEQAPKQTPINRSGPGGPPAAPPGYPPMYGDAYAYHQNYAHHQQQAASGRAPSTPISGPRVSVKREREGDDQAVAPPGKWPKQEQGETVPPAGAIPGYYPQQYPPGGPPMISTESSGQGYHLGPPHQGGTPPQQMQVGGQPPPPQYSYQWAQQQGQASLGRPPASGAQSHVELSTPQYSPRGGMAPHSSRSPQGGQFYGQGQDHREI